MGTYVLSPKLLFLLLWLLSFSIFGISVHHSIAYFFSLLYIYIYVADLELACMSSLVPIIMLLKNIIYMNVLKSVTHLNIIF